MHPWDDDRIRRDFRPAVDPPSHWTFWMIGPGLLLAVVLSDATDTPAPALTYLLVLLLLLMLAGAVPQWWSDRRWTRWQAGGRKGPPPQS